MNAKELYAKRKLQFGQCVMLGVQFTRVAKGHYIGAGAWHDISWTVTRTSWTVTWPQHIELGCAVHGFSSRTQAVEYVFARLEIE